MKVKCGESSVVAAGSPRFFITRFCQGKKVRILGLQGEEHQKYNGKNGAIMGFDPATGRYSVSLCLFSS